MICRDIFTSNITQTKTFNVDETQEIALLMDLDDLSNFWARFQISFSWDYPDGFDVQAVQSAVFHVVGDAETRAQDQLVVGCVQSAGAGVTLTRPLPKVDMVPCEMSFTAHPMAQEFCIRNIVIVSEARNVELYIDDNYEKTARGIMLTIRKGRKVSLFETEFDLTEFIHGTCRCLLKFLSYPEEHSMRLQTIVVRVARLPSNPGFHLQGARPGQVDLTNVRSYLDSLGKPLTPEAQKLLESMEQLQTIRGADRLRSQSVGSQPRLEGLAASTLSGSETSILMQAMSRAKQLEEEEKNERLNRNLPSSPESDEGFINMLAGLMADKNPETAEERTHLENGVDAPESPTLAKHRWETYLQSRVRASRNMVRKSRPVSLGSAFPPQTQAALSPRAQSFCIEDKRVVEKVIAEQIHEPLEKAESDGSDSGSASRCATCGCPGCLSVYNSITTNIYAVEKRIMERVEAKLQSLAEHIDSRLDAISNSLLLRQEQVIVQGLAMNGIPTRKLSQRNGHKPGDSSV